MPLIYDRSKMGGKKPKRAAGPLKKGSVYNTAKKAGAGTGSVYNTAKKAGAGTGTGAQVRAKATRAKPTANPRPKPRRPRMR